MRKKKNQLVIAFNTFAEAISMEKECKKMNITGSLIPVPSQISAGCGLAWKSNIKERRKLIKIMEYIGIENKAIYEVMMY